MALQTQIKYFSDDRQDEFVATLLKFKRDGFYVDIGSGASVGSNNTFFFESLGWKGICVEKNPVFNSSYETRTCRYINEDAVQVDYKKIFKEEGFPESIDYLSLDIDEQSLKALAVLPLDTYRFKVITVEHDSHLYGDLYKEGQRKILSAKGYFLLFGNVLNQSGLNIGQQHAWEDWWVDYIWFNPEYLTRLCASGLTTEQIISKLK